MKTLFFIPLLLLAVSLNSSAVHSSAIKSSVTNNSKASPSNTTVKAKQKAKRGKKHMNTDLQQKIAYIMYGNFTDAELEPLKKMDADILPNWVSVKIMTTEADVSSVKEYLDENAESILVNSEQSKAIFMQSKAAKNAIFIYGERTCSDPKNGFEDFLQISSFISMLCCLDNPTAVFDVRTYSLEKAEQWAKKRLASDEFNIEHEISVTAIPDSDKNDKFWLHTKGMIKFGQPELSMHDVKSSELKAVCDTMNTMAAHIVLKFTPLKHESLVKTEQFPKGLFVAHGGSYEDDEFWGNVHNELVDASNPEKLEKMIHKLVEAETASSKETAKP